MADTTTPPEVMLEFLRLLREAADGETLVPVLRGSLLMHHWFGDRARPPADLDLECFERPPANLEPGESWPTPGRHGQYGEYASLVDFCKATCRGAAEGSQRYRYSRYYPNVPQVPTPAVEFDQAVGVSQEESLWTYGTPGERYFVGWQRHDVPGTRAWFGLVNRPMSGTMQIDMAEPGTYTLDTLPTAPVTLTAPGGETFEFQAYRPETMLAAKLSWIMRGFVRRSLGGRIVHPQWQGELKDLYDAWLLAGHDDLDPVIFQKALLAFSREDGLNWVKLECLFEVVPGRMPDTAFGNWSRVLATFGQSNVSLGPVAIIAELTERLTPLLGYFYAPEEQPFLLAIVEDPIDEAHYLVYADWLEEQGDYRATFLRTYARWRFQADTLEKEEREWVQRNLRDLLGHVPRPWLLRVFGSDEALDRLRSQLPS